MMVCKGDGSASLIRMRRSGAILLLLVAQGALATPVFRCAGAGGAVAFQDTACANHAAQAEVDVRQQPLIDPDAPAYPAHAAHGSLGEHARPGRRSKRQASATSRRAREDRRAVSYECRASDGEVFYRHSKCPTSVPGDGIARFGAGQVRTGSRHGRRASRSGAWGALSVISREIPREEACRKINAVTADGRDGHARDEQVSVYDHNLGRDPCSGY